MAVNPNSPLYSLDVVNSYNSAKAQQTTAAHRSAAWNYIKYVVGRAGSAHKSLNENLDNVNETGDTSYLFSGSSQSTGPDSSGPDSSGPDSSGSDSSGSVFTRPVASGSGAGSGFGGSSPVTYSDWSPAAKMFGMNQSTAYAEHLANTAHQREVADLKAAGLNPVLGLGSGASTVSGSVSGSSGGGYASSAEKSPIQGIADVIGSIAGVIVTASTKDVSRGAAVSSATAKAIGSIGKLIDDLI